MYLERSDARPLAGRYGGEREAGGRVWPGPAGGTRGEMTGRSVEGFGDDREDSRRGGVGGVSLV